MPCVTIYRVCGECEELECESWEGKPQMTRGSCYYLCTTITSACKTCLICLEVKEEWKWKEQTERRKRGGSVVRRGGDEGGARKDEWTIIIVATVL